MTIRSGRSGRAKRPYKPYGRNRTAPKEIGKPEENQYEKATTHLGKVRTSVLKPQDKERTDEVSRQKVR